MYFLFAFAYTVPVPHLPYIFKKVTHKNFTDKLFFHSALISKKVVYNNAIFRKDKTYFKYFKGHMRFQESAFLTFHALPTRSEEHTSDSSHITISYAVFCLKKKKQINIEHSYKKHTS